MAPGGGVTLHIRRQDADTVYDVTVAPASCPSDLHSGGPNCDLCWCPSALLYKPSDQQVTSAGWVDIADLSFDVEANKAYIVEAHMVFRSSLTTMGVLLGFTGPASPTLVSVLSRKQALVGVGAFAEAVIAAYDTANPVSTSEIAANANLLQCFSGTFYNGPNAGTFKMRMSKENVAGTATVKAGSLLRFRRAM